MSVIELKHRIPVLMPVFNNVEYTKKAVASLVKHTDNNLFELLIIDNGSTDETPQFLKSLVDRNNQMFRVLTLPKNLGFGGGLNRGLDLISSFKWEYAVIANNDLLFTPKWLKQMLETMTTAPVDKVGIVGPMSNFAGGSQGMAANYRTVDDLDKFSDMHHQMNKGKWHEAGVVVGLLMLFRRQFYDEVGFFDERFFPGTWEENDWELRGAIKGWKYVVDRSTFIHHYGSKTIQTTEESKDQRKNFVTNKQRFRDKWCGVDSPWETLAKSRYLKRGQDPEKYKQENGKYRKWVVAACRVKNGAKWMDMTLERMSKIADEIVILVDQATTDNTEEICAKYPKVIAIEKEPPHEYNEAWSRNRVLQMAYDRHPDWIACFDCDEVWEMRAAEDRESLTDPDDPAVMMWVQPIVQLWNSNNTQRVDGLWGSFYQGRMFRVVEGQKINNSNNLIHSGSTPYFPPDRHGFSYFRIIHYGNVDPKVRANKYDWYTKTDTDKDLNMALGHWKEHYWKLYYGHPSPQDQANFTGQWNVIVDDKDWARPPYGSFYQRDVYRHVNDEKGMILIPFDEKPIVSLCMLVKNEAGLLAKAISSVRTFINELIVIDTGSTDGSDEVAERLGAKVRYFDWKHDFSAARNFSLSHAKGDWILRIDPDETVPWETAIQIPSLIRNQQAEGYVFPIINWLQDPASTQNANWALSETCRLFKNQYPTIHYSNPVHEELDDSFTALGAKREKEFLEQGSTPEEAKEKGKVLVAKVPFQMFHYGYLREKNFLDKKFDYYYQLGERHLEMNPEDSRPWFNRAVHEMHMHRYQDAIKSYQKTLELDPKNFMAANDVGCLYLTVLGDIGRADEMFRRALSYMTEHTHQSHKERVEKNLDECRLRMLSRMIHI